jgi:hypothetical protein
MRASFTTLARMSEEISEPPDHTTYYDVSFSPDKFDFLYAAMTFYRDLLQKEVDDMKADTEVKELFTLMPSGEEDGLFAERDKLNHIVAFYENKKKAGESGLDKLSHGAIRHTKSVALLYLNHLRQKRNELAMKPNLSRRLLKQVDEDLTRKEEFLTSSSTFKNATPVPLLVDQVAPRVLPTPVQLPTPLSHVERARAQVLDSIPILDPTLRRRCLPLFKHYFEEQKHEQYYTVIADSTKILEDR